MTKKKFSSLTPKHDPNILRQGTSVTIMAPVAQVLAEFGPDSAPNNHKDN